MSSQEPITHWLRQLESGDAEAARGLWDHYFRNLVELARARLQNFPRQATDEEDIALSAFASFCRGVENGRFAGLLGRDSLWRLLVHITACKIADHARRQRAQKRSPERGPVTDAELDLVVGREPSPEFAAEVVEECRRLLDTLPEDVLRSVALWRMEGWTVEEIADKLKCAPVTVKRKLARIRSIWASSAA
jgi:RNA polymerase sigma factor (sigma-70 family)